MIGTQKVLQKHANNNYKKKQTYAVSYSYPYNTSESDFKEVIIVILKNIVFLHLL